MIKSRVLPVVIGSLLAIAILLLATNAWGGDSQKGFDAYNGADYETALTLWQPLAEAGDADSQFGLGQMYGNGFGVPMDDALAIKWYGLAVEQDHAMAQNNLAIMHQNGWGVTQSDEEAAKLFTRAAEQGNVQAMMALGRYYEMDYCEDYDPVAAFKWYGIAQMLGDIDAGARRDMLADNMTAEQVAQANGLVEVWSVGHTELLAKQ
jgi:TPR repeat protein